jgi:hypothetical protein
LVPAERLTVKSPRAGDRARDRDAQDRPTAPTPAAGAAAALSARSGTAATLGWPHRALQPSANSASRLAKRRLAKRLRTQLQALGISRAALAAGLLPVQVPVVSPSESSQELLDRLPIRELDQVAQRLRTRAAEAVLSGTEWLTARQVGERANPNAANKHDFANRLLKGRHIFAIQHQGQNRFPAYALDDHGRPLPAIAQVMAVLQGYEPRRLASWFESTSSHLGGRRPREVIQHDPQAVVSAARAHAEGPLHG